MSDSRFTGFPTALFGFFRDLAANNSNDWLDRYRDEYKTQVLATIRFFVAELGEAIRVLNPNLEVEPRVGRTISRLGGAARSECNGSPFRPFVQVSYPLRGKNGSGEPLLYTRIAAAGISVGFYPGNQRSVRRGLVQESIRTNLRAFQRYLVDRRISQKYWELTDGSDGLVNKWPLPKTARRWIDLESFTVGEFFNASDQVVSQPGFLDRARVIMLDLYPLWLFAKSDNLARDLELYRENAMILSRPLSGSKRVSHDRRQLRTGGGKPATRSARSVR
jgi:hypothetical protein